MEGVAELVIEQVCYFPDSRRFLFTWLYMCVGEHVCVWPSNTETKSLHSCYMRTHIRSCTHTHAHSASRGSLLNRLFVLWKSIKVLKNDGPLWLFSLSSLFWPSPLTIFLPFSFSSLHFLYFLPIQSCEWRSSSWILRFFALNVSCCVQLPCPFIMMLSDVSLLSWKFLSFGFDRHEETHPFTPLPVCTFMHKHLGEKRNVWVFVCAFLCVSVCVCLYTERYHGSDYVKRNSKRSPYIRKTRKRFKNMQMIDG